MSEEAEKQIAAIHAVIVKREPVDGRLVNAARKVVAARYYIGDDGWDKLKNAIAEMEGVLTAYE